MLKAAARILLRYQGKDYPIEVRWDNWEGTPSIHDAQYLEDMWEEGNYSCDCNRSRYIRQYYDQHFPELECGETIEMVSYDPFTVDIVEAALIKPEA